MHGVENWKIRTPAQVVWMNVDSSRHQNMLHHLHDFSQVFDTRFAKFDRLNLLLPSVVAFVVRRWVKKWSGSWIARRSHLWKMIRLISEQTGHRSISSVHFSFLLIPTSIDLLVVDHEKHTWWTSNSARNEETVRNIWSKWARIQDAMKAVDPAYVSLSTTPVHLISDHS